VDLKINFIKNFGRTVVIKNKMLEKEVTGSVQNSKVVFTHTGLEFAKNLNEERKFPWAGDMFSTQRGTKKLQQKNFRRSSDWLRQSNSEENKKIVFQLTNKATIPKDYYLG
jgi:hypothetical protein